MKKITIKAVFTALIIAQLTGCMGSMGLSQQVADVNVKATDNKYGRAGLHVLMYPAYYLSAGADLLVFNSIEFWSGSNPVTGDSAMIEVPYRNMVENKKIAREAIAANQN